MLYLPRTMDNWPWPRAINPYYKEIRAQSDAWFHGLKAFNKKSQRAIEMIDTGEFWDRGRKTATPSAARHMVESLTSYLNSCVEQAADRDNDCYRTVDEYFKNRRENIAARPAFVPMELGMDFPDEVFYHPVIVELSIHIADLLTLDNDLVSYNKEQATGDDRHNILTVVMRQFKLDLDSAMDWVAQYHEEVETRFLDGLKRVPSWGPEIDKNMEVYINGLANWPRCNVCYSFESGRYFGKKGIEFQQTRWVPLLPKVAEYPAAKAKRENIVIPLFFASDNTEKQTSK
ncbi:terpenoid synthase [Agrocybe pediades]|nr:terpenoid synthase [Agrocybe pediades]